MNGFSLARWFDSPHDAALREAQTIAAPEPRRVTQEAIEMAAAKRQEMSEAKARVLDALTDREAVCGLLFNAQGYLFELLKERDRA